MGMSGNQDVFTTQRIATTPFPYESSLDGHGVCFGIGQDHNFDGTSIKVPTQRDWRASFSEHSGTFDSHKAIAFDTQTMAVQYFQDDSSMTAHLVPGSPYMTFELNGGIKSFNGKALSVSDQGTKFTIVGTKGTTYLIYSDSTIKLTAKTDNENKGTLVASDKFSGIIRLVMLRDPSHQTLLNSYSTAYPVSVAQDYSISVDSGTVTFKWETKGTGDLLMLTWPHHREALQSPNSPQPTALSYLTLKGWIYPTLGNTWRLTYKLSAITWNAPRDVDPSCKESVVNGLKYEVGQLDASKAPAPNDFYFWGGTLAAKSRLALIADHVRSKDLIDPVIKYLKASYDGWFSAASKTLPAYETTWGGVISKEGATNSRVDFGNGYFNDHHFHYGCFLHIAAVIAKYDANWLNQHKGYVTLFAQDIINPSAEDLYFPITRCRDWFAGHSWASGIANGVGSRDQESVGEAVNGYCGAMHWAAIALDGAWLFWGAEKVQIAAIQILPVTPVNEVMYDAEWVSNVFSYTMPELANASYADSWKSVIYVAYANAKPQEAAAWSTNLSDWARVSTNNADTFSSAYVPNAGILQLTRNKQFVTADQSGASALSAARATASTWERFAIRPKVGESQGVLSIKVASNGKYVRVSGDGSLVNDGAVEENATGFRFVNA
ncbi:glycosyl hydrolase family 81-domain-containing protein [Fusarium redolens]|uniref:glucan endo-1,3-beta-D-glucosidase n=1 Tax=Fusarium redolens TaxID=48865 RepID=A0A9P9JX18_FUSRE|nr:glycosyl hydrolase family 81-domain-containing protein [Fusarium redolens]KAH7240148.1 glycosyl hydrolase family 81-domain-containing protein [Fusarium redolens]